MKLKPLFTFCFHCFFLSAISQTIPAGRTTDWTHAGLAYHFLNPTQVIDFSLSGGIGDSVTPNDAALNSLLATIAGDSAVIFFPNGNFLFNSFISLPSHIVLLGENADSSRLFFNLGSESHLIKVNGNLSADTSGLFSSAYHGETSVQVINGTLFQAGDLIYLIDNDDSLVESSWAEGTTGQVLSVNSVAGNTLTFDEMLRRNFHSFRNPRIKKINPVRNVGIENLTIYNLTPTIGQTSQISFSYATNSRVKCVKSYQCNFAHVEVNFSSHLEISGSYFQDAFDYGSGGKAYGVMVEFGSGDCLVRNNIFYHLRHSMILQAGSNGNVFAYNYSSFPFWTGVALPSNSAGDLVLHGNYPYLNLFEGNVGQNLVIDDSHANNGPFNTFFRNRLDLYGIVMNTTTPSDSQNFAGNEVTNSGLFMGNFSLAGTGHFQTGNNILGTATPAGSDTMTEASLIYSSFPEFYLTSASWPPIGYPNTLNQFKNQSQWRYLDGSLIQCVEDSLVNLPLLITQNENPVHLNFPNPFFQTVYVFSEHPRIEIWDVLGRMVFEEEALIGLNTISVSFLAPGVYLFVQRDEKGLIQSPQRMVKQ